MNPGDDPVNPDALTLRERAEGAIEKRARARPETSVDVDAHRLIHELQVHEIELAMQCDELRSSRAEVETERARYADLYDFAPTGYLTLSRDGRITEANLTAASLLGTDRSTLLRGTFSQHVAWSDRHLLLECMESAFGETQRVDCDLELARALPKPRSVHFEGVANENGTLLRVSLLDITARRAAEEEAALRDRAIRAVAHGVIITDPHQPDNPIIYVNPGFEKMTGYSAAEAVGRNCRFLQGPDTDPAQLRTLREAAKAGVSCAVEILNYTRSGDPFWNALSITPVRDTNGRLTHFIGVQIDLSERRQLERELQQAQRMEVVGRLAGGVAHDFNNLLTVINGVSDILESSLVNNDPRRELAREIGKAGARAAVLTRQLLAFSRRQVMTMQVLDLNVLVTDTATMLRRLIGEDIDLRVDCAEESVYVKADSAQLEQVLMNLALNARDAMPQGGALTIRTAGVQVDEGYRSAHNDVGDLYHATRREMRSGPYIVLTVTDTGVGMDAATAARVFEPFFTTKGVGQGTGLGLSMVYGVVRQSEGYIIVSSELNRGSEFRIFLPALARGVSDGAPELRESLAGTETVFLVEDEASVRALAARALRDHGYHVLEAGNGREALQLAVDYDGRIDLLLTDVVMPEMGGRALAEALRQTRPLTRLLFMSGYPDDEVLRRGIQQDRTAFLEKPFTQSTLTRKVRSVLDARVELRSS